MARLEVRLQPGAGRNQIVGMRDGRLVVRVAAPPLDGRANQALCKLIAKRLRVGRTKVAVASGERSRDKVLEIEGVDGDALKAAFSEPGS